MSEASSPHSDSSASERPVERPAAAIESGWLIEHESHFPRHRWLRLLDIAHDGIARAEITWTEDSSLALRFARRYDARLFALLHPGHCTLALLTEHQWGL